MVSKLFIYEWTGKCFPYLFRSSMTEYFAFLIYQCIASIQHSSWHIVQIKKYLSSAGNYSRYWRCKCLSPEPLVTATTISICRLIWNLQATCFPSSLDVFTLSPCWWNSKTNINLWNSTFTAFGLNVCNQHHVHYTSVSTEGLSGSASLAHGSFWQLLWRTFEIPQVRLESFSQ